MDWADLIGEDPGKSAGESTGGKKNGKRKVGKAGNNGRADGGNTDRPETDSKVQAGNSDEERNEVPQLPPPSNEENQDDFEEFDASAYEWEEPGRKKSGRTAGLSGKEADELLELTLKAQRAQLMQEINKELLQQRKIEQETLKLEKEAGEVMELSFAEFLFLGYIEKANIDFCGMTKKLKAQIVSLATEKDGAGIVRLIEKEVTSILKTIKRNQKRDLTAWKRENARARSGAKKKGAEK